MTVTPCGEKIPVGLGKRTENVDAAMTQVGQDTSHRIRVFIGTGASSDMVAEDSALGGKVVNQKACRVRIKGSCGISTAQVKGALRFRLWNDRDEQVYQSRSFRRCWTWS